MPSKIDQHVSGDDQIVIAKGDGKRKVEATMTDKDGEVIPIAGWTVEFHMVKLDSAGKPESTLKVKAAATLLDAPNGVVQYQLSATDTNEEGVYRARFWVKDASSDEGWTGFFIIRIEDVMPISLT